MYTIFPVPEQHSSYVHLRLLPKYKDRTQYGYFNHFILRQIPSPRKWSWEGFVVVNTDAHPLSEYSCRFIGPWWKSRPDVLRFGLDNWKMVAIRSEWHPDVHAPLPERRPWWKSRRDVLRFGLDNREMVAIRNNSWYKPLVQRLTCVLHTDSSSEELFPFNLSYKRTFSSFQRISVDDLLASFNISYICTCMLDFNCIREFMEHFQRHQIPGAKHPPTHVHEYNPG